MMPELPEVETVRRGLNTLIIGRKVAAVEHDTPKGFPNSTADVKDFLIDATITGVRRRAKVLLIDLSTEYTLVIHLKMTGQLVFVGAPHQESERFGAGHPNASLVGKLPDKSTRVILTFADGSHLYFNDQRKFGWMKLMPTLEVPNIDFMKRVGPEPLEADFTPEMFAKRFARRPRTSIKAALLDQTVVAGVGNIYADESLWGAKIHPLRQVNTITHDEFGRLYTELRAMMNLAIEKGGSTDKNYVNAEGKRGSYLDFARVFRREGKPCPRCGTSIIKFRAAGRGTHICPHCQVLGGKA
ncbi:bifunctional DNA-formamidopyrimidine glycosylase/DNA-(apurinic or apyrimidinic site) lyase [Streptomyces caniscabiei]|uniref:bifunctional DNA-formamidopyrimidine glycosylase/DNA-(apurinic or apyrimidinic site) lyase n=1 Tax=Streptomyces caniscabiei TaxID=2746961 RepID=UPI0029BCD4D1|nr:bifunctional DNA-formamidopyrimidine glycosylase/DNA-(apurinic or apyrimidinic site) lyase [Streptomyces caniscabiei]MDX2776334.1 bifunctional DNA-formamidopyrimidine glycosylase/DNA-(apurinic or apyrimidinic site) lyase [Streptomyces caniscabiei]